MAIEDLILRNKKDELVERDSASSWFSSFNKDVDRLFEDFFSDFGSFKPSLFKNGFNSSYSPDLNVSEDDKRIHVSVELPGLDEKDIQVSLDKDVLTLKGEKKEESEHKDKEYSHYERRYGSFHRSVKLPVEVNADKIKAKFKKGVLKIELPKSEKAKENVRMIEVN